MAIILDADVIIRGEKEAFDLKRWLASRPDEQFEVAAITVAELWHGVERAAGTHRAKRQQYLQGALASLPVIPYTEPRAAEAVESLPRNLPSFTLDLSVIIGIVLACRVRARSDSCSPAKRQ